VTQPRKLCIGIFVAAGLFVGCQHDSPRPVEEIRELHQDVVTLAESSDTLGCKDMMDRYCSFLYSGESYGNLKIRNETDEIFVLQGKSPNGLPQVFIRYAQSKLRSRNLFPQDFRRILEYHGYFEKLQSFINHPPRTKMNLQQRLRVEQVDYEIGMIWESAVNETVLVRLEAKYPGFYRLRESELTHDVKIEKKRIRQRLIAEISRVIWRHDRHWKRVEGYFNMLKKNYLTFLDELNIDENLRNNWKNRISVVSLAIPGSFPEISDEECSSTKSNAYYYSEFNVITICAGDFNSEDILETLAHELGHAIDINRSHDSFERQSIYYRKYDGFKTALCTPKAPFACDAWDEFKQQNSQYLASLGNFKPELYSFQKCLQRRPVTKALDDGEVRRIAGVETQDRISNLASQEWFSHIISEDLMNQRGKKYKNRDYMNPCSYSLWEKTDSSLSDDVVSLIFFTAEYRCSQEPDRALKLKNSIEVSKTLTEQLMAQLLKSQGEFSSLSILENGGYSSSPVERFADVMGSYVLARTLDQITKDPVVRRKIYLASSSWLCSEPDFLSSKESSVERDYVLDVHTETEFRKKELISIPVRKSLSCEKDFDFDECLPPLLPK
jgi:hypothetical protein